MPFDLTVLTNRAECDEALDDLAAELDNYQTRNVVLDHADRQSGRVKQSVDGQLIGVNAKIDSYTATLGQANLPAKMRKQTESLLLTANYQKAKLTERAGGSTGSGALLAEVDAAQVDAQVGVLTDAIAQVTARKAALPA